MRPRSRLAELRPMRMYERLEALSAMAFASVPEPELPHRLFSSLPAMLRWRSNPAGTIVAAAARRPDHPAIVDDAGELTFAQLDQTTSALARTWLDAGLGASTVVGILAHNGRIPLQAGIAAQKIGADVVYLNSGFSGPQVAGVVRDEAIDVLVYDDALASQAADANPAVAVTETALHAAVASDGRPLRRAAPPGRIVVLTSGTTGRPRGAGRAPAAGQMLDAAGVLSCIPVQSGDTAVVAAPCFHGLGLFTTNLSLALCSTVVLRTRFEPEQVLRDIQTQRAAVLVVVPVMLQRILALPARVLDAYDTTSLRIVLSGGSALSGHVATTFMDRFGDVLYNVYGSTETALATVAQPRVLRAAPGTAGTVVPGVTLRIVDADGNRLPAGQSGRILVGSSLRSDGYTGGGGREAVAGLLTTGDVGRVDRLGRLFIEGRDDEMIVSGGENVFPAEVEETLEAHPAIVEAAVLGVEDEQYGQRLRAFVVLTADATLDEDSVRGFVRGRLARFKVPRDVVFLDKLPRNATGKTLKRELI